MAESVAATQEAPGPSEPRTITIERTWAIAGAVATALVIAALAIALVALAGDSRGDFPRPPGGPEAAGFGGPMGAGGGMPAPPPGFEEGGPSGVPLPEGVPGPQEGYPEPDTDGSSQNDSGANGSDN
jgi:hypothetical protein